MRVALLTSSDLFASRLEENLDAETRGAARLVWTVDHPGSVLAALDHDPALFVLDMRWREEAMAAGRMLLQAGMERVLCLFDHLDDPLIPPARALGFEVVQRASALTALLDRLLA